MNPTMEEIRSQQEIADKMIEMFSKFSKENLERMLIVAKEDNSFAAIQIEFILKNAILRS